MCESASCGEVFLLASAALANITFFDSMACEILLQLNAIQILLQACRDRQRVDTPYSKDQVRQTETPEFSARNRGRLWAGLLRSGEGDVTQNF